MKKTCLILLLSFLSTSAIMAQESDGYYISKKGDTIRGKIQIPLKPKLKAGASSGQNYDPLGGKVPDESTAIEYSKLTFDFKFSEDGTKFKKMDRLKVKGFGFLYNGHAYDFISWDVTANKQLYLIPATGDVAPDGVYFILRSLNGALPVYSLFQEIEVTKKNNGRNEYDGNATKRDIVFEHPLKGYIYISDQYPLLLKLPETLKYLQLEEAFIKTLDKKETLFTVVMKYNEWRANH
ncbi:MAG: hypothetical protein HZA79_03755 [Sphingobacteriales bacterium]|nr:hypothetical protein [Sphingobacteriales bacterium]